MAGIYIHIPYCKQACTYCNFHFSTNQQNSDAMLISIANEINLRKNYLENQPIESIYFGGGTPGILQEKNIEKILLEIKNNFQILPNAEITIEVNPDDMNKQKLEAYLKMGINRLSVGTQSFFEEDLKYMNRSHNALAAATCIETAHSVGFKNISLDLIYGYPLLTNNKWQQNFNTALQLGITHLSCYAMTVEPKTVLEHKINKNILPKINNSQSAAQFQLLMQWIANAGWEHYEISNFCKPNFRAVHNTNYWLGKWYLGIGPSAHSFNGTSRQWNIANNTKYIYAINNKIIPSETEILTPYQQINEYIMTSLRMSDGLHLSKIQNNCTAKEYQQFLNTITQYQNYITIQNEKIILNNNGKLIADKIASDLFIGL